MKKKEILVFIVSLLIAINLLACAEEEIQSPTPSKNDSKKEQDVNSEVGKMPPAGSIPLENETEKAQVTNQESKEDTTFFDTIYAPYANRTRPWLFTAVKAYVEKCGYECEISEATDDKSSKITIKDSHSDDYVYMHFMPFDGDLEIIMLITYNSSKKGEISTSNYSGENNLEFDQYKTPEGDVGSVEEQKTYIFKN